MLLLALGITTGGWIITLWHWRKALNMVDRAHESAEQCLDQTERAIRALIAERAKRGHPHGHG